jgi:hypothetical protein
MIDSTTNNREQRVPLSTWLKEHKNSEMSMDAKHALRTQSGWVDQSVRHMVFRALVSRVDPRMVDPDEFLTVDGSYFVGDMELPVYRFDMNGVTIKMRHDLRDWCVRIWGTTPLLVSSYLTEALIDGDYGVIEGEENEPSGEFCVNCPEHVYAVLWDALTAHREAVEADHEDTMSEMVEDAPPQEQTEANEPTNGNNHYIVTGRIVCCENMTKYVVATTAVEAEDKFRDFLLSAEINKDEPRDSVIFELVIQIPGPPIAIYSEDELIENPEPLM